MSDLAQIDSIVESAPTPAAFPRSVYVEHNAPGIGPIVSAAFPNNRKPISVETFRGPMNVNSYWDGGSRDVYKLVDLATLRVIQFPSSHPAYDRKESGERCGELQLAELPEGTALIWGGVFCGKNRPITVLLRPENLALMLPAPTELSDRERAALNAIAGIKGGNYRREEFDRRGLGEYSATNPLIVSLASKKLVTINRCGSVAVTVAGRNAR